MTRAVGDHVVHFERGHQHDPHNRIEARGDPNATPFSYYCNALVTSRAGHLSDRGRYNWLTDVQAVTPTERMPVFYRRCEANAIGLTPWMKPTLYGTRH